MHEATVGHLLRGEGDDQEILLGKRNSHFCHGMWNGAGGKMKPDEKPLVGLRREIKEEWNARIDVKSARHFASVDFYHPYPNGEHRLDWRVHFYQVTSWTGKLRIIEGFSEFRWFKLNDMPYREMNIDNRMWIPIAHDGLAAGKVFKGEVFYGDSQMKSFDRISFQLVPV